MKKEQLVTLPPLTALQASHVLKACRLYRNKAVRDYDPTYVPHEGKKNSQLAKRELMDEIIPLLERTLKEAPVEK